MILCMDIGNTNIKYAVYDGDELKISFRVATELKRTSDEYGNQLVSVLQANGIPLRRVTGGIMGSVVPQLDYTIERMCELYLDFRPLVLAPGLKTGVNLKVDDAREVGADRVVNSVSALNKYGAPLIIVDFGTATTFNAVNSRQQFVGGVIAPGMKGSLDSLVNGTAMLPRVEIERPDNVIGTNTVTNIQSGIFYGFAGLVEYIVRRMKEELGEKGVKTVATGGFSDLIADEISGIDYVDKFLTLDGLKYLYYLNSKD